MPACLHLPRNAKGRDFVVGDIHGCFDLLDKGLLSIRFNEASDRLIAVGDLVDRGPESPRAYEFLQKPWFWSVQGNHEEMFRRGLMEFFDVTNEEPLLLDFQSWMAEMPLRKLATLGYRLSQLPLAIEVETDIGLVGIVHAEVPRGQSWNGFKTKLAQNDERTIASTKWAANRLYLKTPEPVRGLSRLFCGHMTQYPSPVQRANMFYIDTGAHRVERYRMNMDEPAWHAYEYNALTIVELTAPADKITAINKPNSGLNIILNTPV